MPAAMAGVRLTHRLDRTSAGRNNAYVACVFCSIVAGSSPAYLIHEDEHSVAFLDLNPATEGHTLVVPRHHADDIWSIEPAAFAAVARTTHL